MIFYSDFGTYCDFVISQRVIMSLLEKKIPVLYVTNDSNKVIHSSSLISNPLLEVITYNTTLSVQKIVQFADTKHLISNILDQPMQWVPPTYNIWKELANVFTFVADVIKKNIHRIDVIIMTYPLWGTFKKIQTTIPKSIPIIIFYVAPAFPNIFLPWIFDNILKDPDYTLFNYKNRDYNIKSHAQYDWGISLLANSFRILNPYFGYTYYKNYLMNKSSNLYIISSWNKNLIPSDVYPISVPKKKWFHINSVIDKSLEPLPPLPSVVAAFVNKPGLLVYLTMGSFEIPTLNVLVKVVLKALRKQKRQYKLLVQDNRKQLRIRSKEDLLIFNGFIPYSTLLQQTKILITTGSYCIQHIALYNKVPMVFVPVLAEQYFWAKNYQRLTGVPYIDNVKDISDTSEQVNNISNIMTILSHKNKVLKAFHKDQYDPNQKQGTDQFISVIRKIIEKQQRENSDSTANKTK